MKSKVKIIKTKRVPEKAPASYEMWQLVETITRQQIANKASAIKQQPKVEYLSKLMEEAISEQIDFSEEGLLA